MALSAIVTFVEERLKEVRNWAEDKNNTGTSYRAACDQHTEETEYKPKFDWTSETFWSIVIE
jgi:hypothetical protein